MTDFKKLHSPKMSIRCNNIVGRIKESIRSDFQICISNNGLFLLKLLDYL